MTTVETVVGSAAAQAALLQAASVVIVGTNLEITYVVTFERLEGKRVAVRAQSMKHGELSTERSLGPLGIENVVSDDPLTLEACVRRTTGTLGRCAIFLLEEGSARGWLWVTPTGHTLTLDDKKVRVAF